MLKSILIVIGLMLAAFLLLSVCLIFKKGGRFHSMHISDSRAMRERGIGCVQSQDRNARKSNPHKLQVNQL